MSRRPPPTLKAKALALIAQREHSRIELRRKLARHRQKLAERAQASLLEGVAPTVPVPEEGEIDALLDWLASKDLLSTERFVETRVQARAARFGNLRIRQELAQHGIELDPETAQQLKASEVARARAVWLKRFGQPALDAAGRAKQMRFLAARGFAAEVVRRVVGGVEDPT
ncbi:RecX family transcriptional regulator [Caldimonas sp. KR1-144]|uniref:RecX family transcriptional regulator n=1 Tax=Caldimonas sp. KR1-144 TaxID=3400911 RepID=UPI003C093C46